MKPATELPWDYTTTNGIYTTANERGETVGRTFSTQDCAYIVHACNAYPKLVQELKAVMGALSLVGYGPTNAWDTAAALLRELGEEA